MVRYTLKRLLYMLAVLLLLSLIVYFVYNLMPVDKAADMAMQEISANKNLNYAERYLYWQRRYGLDGSVLGVREREKHSATQYYEVEYLAQ